MRARSARLTILILLILALALASLGFRDVNIDLPGFPALDRGGTGPLGLKLGLDLRGGGHLVYQADTGTRLNVEFPAPDPFATQIGTAQVTITTGSDSQETSDSPADQPDVAGTAGETTTETTGADTTGAAADTAEPGESTADSSGQTSTVEAEVTVAGEEADQENQAPPVISISEIEGVIEGILEIEFEVEERDVNSFRVKTGLVDDATVQSLRERLEKEFGPASLFDADKILEPTSDQMMGVLDIINRRVNRFGTEEPIIQTFGDDRIVVQLPGATGSITNVTLPEPFAEGKDYQDVLELIAGVGIQAYTVTQIDGQSFEIRSETLSRDLRDQLQADLVSEFGGFDNFEISSAIDDAKALIGQTAQLEFKERTCTDITCLNFTDAEIGLTGDDLERADVTTDQSGVGWAISIQFDNRGADVFSDLTERLFRRQDTGRIAIFLDDEEVLAPVSLAWIRDGRSQITGNFTREEARTLAIQLESGRLPVPLKLIQESDVDALLGSESLRNSLLAGLVGLALVMVFMLAYYRMSGVVASLALVFYAVVVLALFKLIPITLTLSHIGGFILSIGMAVDANILIFERMKEEIRTGRTLASSMEVGFNRAWPAIRDSNVSTFITCLVLLWFGDRLGGGLVTGFALSLLIGVAVSMFTAVVLSRNLLQLLAWIGLSHRIQLFTPEKIQRTAPAVGGGS